VLEVRLTLTLLFVERLMDFSDHLGWGDIVDPGLFSQALMHYASETAAKNWPGEPETDPTSEEPVQVSGKHIEPTECMDVALRHVLRDPSIDGGVHFVFQCH